RVLHRRLDGEVDHADHRSPAWLAQRARPSGRRSARGRTTPLRVRPNWSDPPRRRLSLATPRPRRDSAPRREGRVTPRRKLEIRNSKPERRLFGFRVSGLEFRVSVSGFEFRVSDFEFSPSCLTSTNSKPPSPPFVERLAFAKPFNGRSRPR